MTKAGADAAIMVGEVWLAPYSDRMPYQQPSESPVRKEGLELTLVRKTGEPVQLIAMIIRDGDTVSLDDTSRIDGGAEFSFAPFYKAWGRPIPETWIELVRTATGENEKA